MYRDLKETFVEIVLPVVAIVATIVALASAVVAVPVWFSACKSAEIYNGQNDTAYTCADFFWAADQINSQTQTVKLR